MEESNAGQNARFDALDARLVTLLAEQPRIGVLECARRLGVARGTAQARLDRLQARGVITGFGPDLDPGALGFVVSAFVTLEIAQGELHDLTEQLSALPEVLEAYATTGSSDVLCRLAASSNEDLQQTLLALARLPLVSRSTSVVVLSVVVAPRTLPLLGRSPRPAPRRAPAYRLTGC